MKSFFLKIAIVLMACVSVVGCGGDDGGDFTIAKDAVVQASGLEVHAVSHGPASVDVYGDSVSIGVGVEVSPLMRLVEYRPNWEVVHHSAGGLSYQSIVGGYSEPFPNAHPIYFPMGPQRPFGEVPRTSRYIVLGGGINDAIRDSGELDLQRFDHDLRYLVRTVLQEGRVPIITGVINISNNPVLRDQYNQITLQVAEEFGVEHAGWGEAYGAEGVGPDTVHPHQQASDVLASRLLSAIDRAIAKDTPVTNNTGFAFNF